MRKAFTIVELMVVVAMIAIILGAMSGAVTGVMERARVSKAKSEVKIIAQAILAYENESKDGRTYELPTMEKAVCNRDSIGFLLGRETSQSGRIPVLLMAALSNGGEMVDPWGHPYRVTIKKTSNNVDFRTLQSLPGISFMMPNAYRLQKEDR